MTFVHSVGGASAQYAPSYCLRALGGCPTVVLSLLHLSGTKLAVAYP